MVIKYSIRPSSLTASVNPSISLFSSYVHTVDNILAFSLKYIKKPIENCVGGKI